MEQRVPTLPISPAQWIFVCSGFLQGRLLHRKTGGILTERALGLSSTLHTGQAICCHCTTQAFRIRFSAFSSLSPLFVPMSTLSHRLIAKKNLWRHGASENVGKSMWRNTVYAKHISASDTRILCGTISWEPPLQLLARKIPSTMGKGNTISISPLSPPNPQS